MAKCRKCGGTGEVVLYQQIQDFNPSSPEQVKALMRHLKLKVPIKRGSQGKETTESRFLRRFGKKHKVFRDILAYRQCGKLKSNYLWVTDANDQVRGQLGFHPSTWRKSMRKPNLMVIPKPTSDLNLEVRETVAAPPGCFLLEADSEGIEAVLVAYETGDERFMKVCKAGPHGFFMAATQGRPISPDLPYEQLKAACKAEKKRDAVLYDIHKRTIHGSHYGLTPFGMNDEYQEQFPTVAIAKHYQSSYFNLWPQVLKQQRITTTQAHEQRYLDNHFQYRHYFYAVLTWDSARRTHVPGDDYKRAIAFRPQSDASACQTEFMLALEARAQGDEGYRLLMDSLNLLIHDSFVFCLPLSVESWAPQAVAEVMNMPFAELGGLRIGVEVKCGPNLREQSTVEVKQLV
jgi:DNA polymerase I